MSQPALARVGGGSVALDWLGAFLLAGTKRAVEAAMRVVREAAAWPVVVWWFTGVAWRCALDFLFRGIYLPSLLCGSFCSAGFSACVFFFPDHGGGDGVAAYVDGRRRIVKYHSSVSRSGC